MKIFIISLIIAAVSQAKFNLGKVLKNLSYFIGFKKTFKGELKPLPLKNPKSLQDLPDSWNWADI